MCTPYKVRDKEEMSFSYYHPLHQYQNMSDADSDHEDAFPPNFIVLSDDEEEEEEDEEGAEEAEAEAEYAYNTDEYRKSGTPSQKRTRDSREVEIRDYGYDANTRPGPRLKKRRRIQPRAEDKDDTESLRKIHDMDTARHQLSQTEETGPGAIEPYLEATRRDTFFSDGYNKRALQNLRPWGGYFRDLALLKFEGNNVEIGRDPKTAGDIDEKYDIIWYQRDPTYMVIRLEKRYGPVFKKRNDPRMSDVELQVYEELLRDLDKTIREAAAFTLSTAYNKLREELVSVLTIARNKETVDDEDIPMAKSPHIEYNDTSGERVAVYQSAMAAAKDFLYQPLTGIPYDVMQKTNTLIGPSAQIRDEVLQDLHETPQVIYNEQILYAYTTHPEFEKSVIATGLDMVAPSEAKFISYVVSLYDEVYDNDDEDSAGYLSGALVSITDSDYDRNLKVVQTEAVGEQLGFKQRAGIRTAYALWDAPTSIGAYSYVHAVLASIAQKARHALRFLLHIHPYPVTLGKNFFLHYAIRNGDTQDVAILLTTMDVAVYEAKFGIPSLPAGTTSRNIQTRGTRETVEDGNTMLRLVYTLLSPFTTFTGDDATYTPDTEVSTPPISPREQGLSRLDDFTHTPTPWEKLREHYSLL